MGLSAPQLLELVSELEPLVLQRLVREAAPLPPKDLLLILGGSDEGGAGDGHVRRLRLSAEAEGARAHLQISSVRTHTGPIGPFYQTLNEALVGARITSLRQVEGDRVLRLDFERGEERKSLVAELTGQHANLVLLDEDERILSILVTPKSKRGETRLVSGSPYQPPPGRGGAPAQELPLLQEALPAPPSFEENSGRARQAAEAPLSWRVEASLGKEAEERWLRAARADLIRRLERRKKAAESRLFGLREKERAGAEAERIRKDGELLQAHRGRLKRGLKELEVPDDFTAGSPARKIALEARLSPDENVRAYFARYKKRVRDAENIPLQISRIEEEALCLERLLGRATAEEIDPELTEAEAIAQGLLKPKQATEPKRRAAKQEPRRAYKSYRSASGAEIRVGKNARDNDQLTFRESRGNDLWLHTADSPGSHVVLRLEKGVEPDQETLLDAATLALHFSPLSGARRASIHVARCKEVKKPRKAPPGLVTLSGGRTLQLRFEPERLDRLLNESGGRRDRKGSSSPSS